jgi:hypothetical protein
MKRTLVNSVVSSTRRTTVATPKAHARAVAQKTAS